MGRLSEFCCYLNADPQDHVENQCFHMEVDAEVRELRRRYREVLRAEQKMAASGNKIGASEMPVMRMPDHV